MILNGLERRNNRRPALSLR